MRKIEKLALRKIVDPSDILKKKQMGNYWGGRETCQWCCTINSQGACSDFGPLRGWGFSCGECWSAAEFFCTPYTEYGIWIQC